MLFFFCCLLLAVPEQQSCFWVSSPGGFFFSVTTNKKKYVAFALLDVTADSTSGFFQTCSYWTAQKIPAQQHFQDLCSRIGKKKKWNFWKSFPFTPKFTRLFSCVQKSEKQQIPKKVGWGDIKNGSWVVHMVHPVLAHPAWLNTTSSSVCCCPSCSFPHHDAWCYASVCKILTEKDTSGHFHLSRMNLQPKGWWVNSPLTLSSGLDAKQPAAAEHLWRCIAISMPVNAY